MVLAEDGRRFRVKNWVKGSHSTSEPKRPATIYGMTPDELEWSYLDSWNVARNRGKGYYKEAPDEDVLKDAIRRLRLEYGVKVETIVYHKFSGSKLSEYPSEQVA
ncbi:MULTISPECIES: hypothetical protein [unclassified Haloferax]|uniref:hypothetical protein n=1 Tax=unclassified Haloferax TaxID=2625095 RepID=UPI0028755DA3|nr:MULTISPECIES: hypothetical protein [unclassified Haloferax]MDS0243081.1 hypothetical protein [Haloferax sp. S2CR25]MDS0446202.1 hypothetical protein [Haloferax sp. S2CR25-2]